MKFIVSLNAFCASPSNSSVCAIFEGFLDFLAYLSFHKHSELPFSGLGGVQSAAEALDKLDSQPFITAGEPAAGAGGMILALVKVMIGAGHNPADKLWVQAIDVDRMAARARGRKGGRKFALTKAQVRMAQAAMAKRDTSISELCRKLGVKPVTLYRYVDPNGNLRDYGRRVLGA